MVDVSEIKDRDSFKAWLESRPEESQRAEAILLANRIALRVLPIYGVWAFDQDPNRDVTNTPIFRALLTSSVAAVSPTDFFF